MKFDMHIYIHKKHAIKYFQNSYSIKEYRRNLKGYLAPKIPLKKSEN